MSTAVSTIGKLLHKAGQSSKKLGGQSGGLKKHEGDSTGSSSLKAIPQAPKGVKISSKLIAAVNKVKVFGAITSKSKAADALDSNKVDQLVFIVSQKEPAERLPDDINRMWRILNFCAFLQALDVRKRNGVLRMLEYRLFAEGEAIFEQGLPAHGVYIVLSGVAGAYRNNKNGEEERLREIGPAETVGESFMQDNETIQSSIRAMSVVECLFLSRQYYLMVVSEERMLESRREEVLSVFQTVAPNCRRPNELKLLRTYFQEQVRCMKDLSNEIVESVAQYAVAQTHDEGTVLCKEGEDPDGMRIILRGTVDVCRPGTTIPIQELCEDDSFGEWALLTEEGKRTAEVRASSQVDVAYVSKAAYMVFLSAARQQQALMDAAFTILSGDASVAYPPGPASPTSPSSLMDKAQEVEKPIRSEHEVKLLETLLEKERLTFFQTLGSEGSRRQLCERMRWTRVFQGEILFQEGDVGDALYVVLRGTLGIFKKDADRVWDNTLLDEMRSRVHNHATRGRRLSKRADQQTGKAEGKVQLDQLLPEFDDNAEEDNDPGEGYESYMDNADDEEDGEGGEEEDGDGDLDEEGGEEEVDELDEAPAFEAPSIEVSWSLNEAEKMQSPRFEPNPIRSSGRDLPTSLADCLLQAELRRRSSVICPLVGSQRVNHARKSICSNISAKILDSELGADEHPRPLRPSVAIMTESLAALVESASTPDSPTSPGSKSPRSPKSPASPGSPKDKRSARRKPLAETYSSKESKESKDGDSSVGSKDKPVLEDREHDDSDHFPRQLQRGQNAMMAPIRSSLDIYQSRRSLTKNKREAAISQSNSLGLASVKSGLSGSSSLSSAFEKSASSPKASHFQPAQLELDDEEEEEEEDEGFVDIEDVGRCIGVAEEGKPVGEWALIQRAPRQASVIALTDCDLLVLDKHTYDEVLGSSRSELVSRELAISILKCKSADERKEPDIHVLESLIVNNDFFAKVDFKIRAEICKAMRYTILKPGNTLFREGEDADSFYLILRGDVGVYSCQGQEPVEDGSNDQFILTIREGGTFGEWALAQNQKRSATIKAGGYEVELIQVMKEDYNRIMRDLRGEAMRRERAIDVLKTRLPEERNDRDVQCIWDMIRGISFFRELDYSLQEDVCRAVTYLKVKPDRMLFAEGDPSDHFFLILRGCVGIYSQDNPEELAKKKPQHHVFRKQPTNVEAAWKTARRPTIAVKPIKNTDEEKEGATGVGSSGADESDTASYNMGTDSYTTASKSHHILMQVRQGEKTKAKFDRKITDGLPPGATIKDKEAEIFRLADLAETLAEDLKNDPLSASITDRIKLNFLKSKISALKAEVDKDKQDELRKQNTAKIKRKMQSMHTLAAATAGMAGPAPSSPKFGSSRSGLGDGSPTAKDGTAAGDDAPPTAGEDVDPDMEIKVTLPMKATPFGHSHGSHPPKQHIIRVPGTGEEIDATGCKAELKEGDGLGEQGLLKDMPRTVSTRTHAETEFVVLDKETFNRILRSDRLRRAKEKIDRLKNWLPKAADQSESALERIALLFKSEVRSRGSVIVKEGSKADYAWLIARGQCTVYAGSDAVDKFGGASEGDHDPHKKSKSRGGAVGVLEAGHFVGLLSCLHKKAQEFFTVLVSSAEAELLCVSKADLRNRVPTQILDSLKEMATVRGDFHLDRCQQIGNLSSQMRPRLDQIHHDAIAHRHPKIEDSPYLRYKRQNIPGGLTSVNTVCTYHHDYMPQEYDFSRNSKNGNFFHHMKFTLNPSPKHENAGCDKVLLEEDKELEENGEENVIVNQRFNRLREHILDEERVHNVYLSPRLHEQREKPVPKERPPVPLTGIDSLPVSQQGSDDRCLTTAGGLSHCPTQTSLNASGVLSTVASTNQLSSVPSTNQLSTVSAEAASTNGASSEEESWQVRAKKKALPIPLRICSTAYRNTYRRKQVNDGAISSARVMTESKWQKPHKRKLGPGPPDPQLMTLFGFRSAAMQRMQHRQYGERDLEPGLSGLAVKSSKALTDEGLTEEATREGPEDQDDASQEVTGREHSDCGSGQTSGDLTTSQKAVLQKKADRSSAAGNQRAENEQTSLPQIGSQALTQTSLSQIGSQASALQATKAKDRASIRERASVLTKRGSLLGLGKPIEQHGASSIGTQMLHPVQDPPSLILGVGTQKELKKQGSRKGRGILVAASLTRTQPNFGCVPGDMSNMAVTF